MERLEIPESTPTSATFDALLAPIASLLAEMAPAIDAQAQSRRLFFVPFVRLLIFALVMRIPSLRQRVTESSERAFLRSMVQAGLTYVADRGYFAFALFDHIHRAQAYFVMRAKENLQYTISQPLSLTGSFPTRWGNLSDQGVLLSSTPTDGSPFPC